MNENRRKREFTRTENVGMSEPDYNVDDDGYEYECPQCGWPNDDPDSWESACIDDLCHGGEVPCMHGDYSRIPCGLCRH